MSRFSGVAASTPRGVRGWHTLARRLLLAGLAAAAIAVGPGLAASAAVGDYIVTSGPHTAERAEDGTTTLKLTVANLSDGELELSLDAASVRCSTTTGKPALDPYSSGKIVFTMSCEPGEEPRAARISPTSAGLLPSSLPVEFTVEPQSESDWSVLWWFLWGAAGAAVVVVTAYGFWFFNPDGNRRKRAENDSRGPGRQSIADSWRERHPLTLLPGITQEWNFKTDWSSNASLAAALFTAVLANTDALESIVGEDATGPLAVVTVAAALSAAVTGTGPLWLVICKRRYEDDPAATHQTVGGVLAASFVVLWGSTGLILSVAVLIDTWQARSLAAIALLVLILYAAKAIPITLAKGALPTRAELAVEGTSPRPLGFVGASGML
jgi:hypothetical protein